MAEYPSPNKTILAPSILAADHANLAEGLKTIEAEGLEWAHVDIMDGHFVPNLSFGPKTVDALRERTGLFLDTHLMLDNPHEYVEAFTKAGASQISIHVEPHYPIAETLDRIRELGAKPGIVCNPGTPAEHLLPYLEQVDIVLCMTVQPGFGGQEFREDVLGKIGQVSKWRSERGLSFRIEVDGGINPETGKRCFERGCDTFVTGTAFFKADDQAAFARAFTSGFSDLQ